MIPRQIFYLSQMKMVTKLNRMSLRALGKVGSPQSDRKESGSLRSRSLCPSVDHTSRCFHYTRLLRADSRRVLKSETSRDVAEPMAAPVFGTKPLKSCGAQRRQIYASTNARWSDVSRKASCIEKKATTVTCVNDPRAHS